MAFPFKKTKKRASHLLNQQGIGNEIIDFLLIILRYAGVGGRNTHYRLQNAIRETPSLTIYTFGVVPCQLIGVSSPPTPAYLKIISKKSIITINFVHICYIASMLLILSHESALEYWRRYPNSVADIRLFVSNRKSPSFHKSIKDLSSPENLNLLLPLDILVKNSGARITSPSVKSHVDCRAFPKGSFKKIGQGLYVSSPELCFLQMAAQMELIQLIRLGFELCGNYRHIAANNVMLTGCEIENGCKKQGFRSDKPLTTVNKLRSYASKMKGARGIQRANRAIRFLIDGSASPAETMLTMMLTLPYLLGGFKLPKPSLNAHIDISPIAKKATVKDYYACDLYWSSKKVAAEYDSDSFHTKSEQITSDSSRRNALLFMGINVITVTRKQLMSSIEMKRIAYLLSRHLGKRLQYHDPDFTENHMRLRRFLLTD